MRLQGWVGVKGSAYLTVCEHSSLSPSHQSGLIFITSVMDDLDTSNSVVHHVNMHNTIDTGTIIPWFCYIHSLYTASNVTYDCIFPKEPCCVWTFCFPVTLPLSLKCMFLVVSCSRQAAVSFQIYRNTALPYIRCRTYMKVTKYFLESFSIGRIKTCHTNCLPTLVLTFTAFTYAVTPAKGNCYFPTWSVCLSWS